MEGVEKGKKSIKAWKWLTSTEDALGHLSDLHGQERY